MSIGGELDTAHQLRRGLEMDLSAGAKVSFTAVSIAFFCAGGISNALCTLTVWLDVLKAVAIWSFAAPVKRMHAANEYVAHAFLEARAGEIGERLARNGKDLLLGPADNFDIQITLFDFPTPPAAWHKASASFVASARSR